MIKNFQIFSQIFWKVLFFTFLVQKISKSPPFCLSRIPGNSPKKSRERQFKIPGNSHLQTLFDTVHAYIILSTYSTRMQILHVVSIFHNGNHATSVQNLHPRAVNVKNAIFKLFLALFLHFRLKVKMRISSYIFMFTARFLWFATLDKIQKYRVKKVLYTFHLVKLSYYVPVVYYNCTICG